MQWSFTLFMVLWQPQGIMQDAISEYELLSKNLLDHWWSGNKNKNCLAKLKTCDSRPSKLHDHHSILQKKEIWQYCLTKNTKIPRLAITNWFTIDTAYLDISIFVTQLRHNFSIHQNIYWNYLLCSLGHYILTKQTLWDLQQDHQFDCSQNDNIYVL